MGQTHGGKRKGASLGALGSIPCLDTLRLLQHCHLRHCKRRPPEHDHRGQASSAPVVFRRPAVSLRRPAHCHRRSPASAALGYCFLPPADAHTALTLVRTCSSRILTPGAPRTTSASLRVPSSLAFLSIFCMPCFACLLVPLRKTRMHSLPAHACFACFHAWLAFYFSGCMYAALTL